MYATKADMPDKLAAILLPMLRHTEQERFLVTLLDTPLLVNGVIEIARGSVNVCAVQPREVFRPAVLANCAAIILAHNHPSGSLKPSQDDLKLTRRLVKAGEVLGIQVLDHLILGRGDFLSLKAARKMN